MDKASASDKPSPALVLDLVYLWNALLIVFADVLAGGFIIFGGGIIGGIGGCVYWF